MPNVRHLPVCPYYQGEANMSIKCEDTYRTFIDRKKRDKWTKKFCDCDWEGCKYAKALNEAYERYYKGDTMAIKEHEIEAMKSEMHGLSIHLGRAKSRIERQQTRIDALREENESYKQVNANISEHRKRLYKELKETKAELEKVNLTMMEQLMRLDKLYKERMAYLIDTKCEDGLLQKDVDAWAKDKDFSIHGEGDIEDRKWIVLFDKEKKDEQLLGEETKTE